MTGLKLSLAAPAACLLLAACMSAPEQPLPTRGQVNIFISPSGEPFRGEPSAPYPIDAWFARADANHDGALTEAEFVADGVAFFHRLDANGDGIIDAFEISNYEQTVAPEILPRIAGLTARDIPALPYEGPDADRRRQEAEQQVDQSQRPQRGRAGPRGAGVFSLIRDPEPVAAADADFDGKVSLAEFTAAMRRRFALLDLDHDGRLTRAELPKTPAERLADKVEKNGRKQAHERPAS